MTIPQASSVIPEVYVVDPNKGSSGSYLVYRSDDRGKEFVSMSGDESQLEWKVSKSDSDSGSLANSISQSINLNDLNATVCLISPSEYESVFSSRILSAVESVCAQFITRIPALDISASCWQIGADCLDDLLNTGHASLKGSSFPDDEVVPETNSVKLRSAVDFQRFLHRIQASMVTDQPIIIRLVLFQDRKIIHFACLHAESAIPQLSSIGAARLAKKSSTKLSQNLTLSERCLLPLMAGNSKPFIMVFTGTLTDDSAIVYQSLFDVCERVCLTSLPCVAETDPLNMSEFDICDSFDSIPPRAPNSLIPAARPAPQPAKSKQIFRPAKPPLVPKENIIRVTIPDAEEENIRQDLSQLNCALASVNRSPTDSAETVDLLEAEVHELKAKVMLLKCELDRAKMSPPSTSGGNAYTAHLAGEVKQLRQELLAVESERRKYLTSRRLIESLVEKSNKAKAEILAKNTKIEEMKKSDQLMRAEMAELKRNCEYLLEANQAAMAEKEAPPVVETVYHEFLFPFGRKREMARLVSALHASVAQTERVVALGCPSAVLEVRKSAQSLEKLVSCVNDLLQASEKLEISASALLSHPTSNSSHSNSTGKLTRPKSQSSLNSRR